MMVFCDGGCEDWYHCSCVDIDEEDAKVLLDKYVCPMCHIPDKLFTTFKPVCRYHNVGKLIKETPCRNIARGTGDPPSKFCSDEHREAFWDFIVTRLRDDDEPSKGGPLNRIEAAKILEGARDIDGFRELGSKPRLPKEEGAEAADPSEL
jgi:COMPASS component SPP1